MKETEEEVKLKLIERAKIECDKNLSLIISKQETDLSVGYLELRKIFPYLKQIKGKHCEVFGYDFFLEGPTPSGKFYLIKVGGDNFDIYQPSEGWKQTYIFTEDDMAKLLHIWDYRQKVALEHLDNYHKDPKSYSKPHNYNKLVEIKKPEPPPVNYYNNGCLIILLPIFSCVAYFILNAFL